MILSQDHKSRFGHSDVTAYKNAISAARTAKAVNVQRSQALSPPTAITIHMQPTAAAVETMIVKIEARNTIRRAQGWQTNAPTGLMSRYVDVIVDVSERKPPSSCVATW